MQMFSKSIKTNTRTCKHTAARNAWRFTNSAKGQTKEGSGNKSARWKKVGEKSKRKPFSSVSRQHALMQILSFCFLYFSSFLFHPFPPTHLSSSLRSFSFSYNALLPAHIAFISFAYLVSHFLKGRMTKISCFLSLLLSFSILASLNFCVVFFMSQSHVVFLTNHIFAYLVNNKPPWFWPAIF